jgi:basic membrane protein A and related proteins
MAATRGQLTSALAALLALAAIAAGCGVGDEEGGGTTTSPSSNVRVALVTDIGGLNDRGFNALAKKA